MRRRPITSSVVGSVGYDRDSQTLEVEFTTGRVYRYLEVPELLYRRLLRAHSAGEFFNAEIRDHFPAERA